MTIAEWNVRTLLDRETTNRPERRTALVAMELTKYNIDIAVLSETRLHASGSLNNLEYTFYWSCKPNGERREAGVGCAIKRDIMAKLTEMPHPVSDRIMSMRIPLTKDRNATIVSAYAPTMTNPEENKETFYSQLKSTLRNIPSTDKLLLIGDFNARIGRENDKWPSALGKYVIEKCNSNGELLLALCTEFDLIVTNTMFKQKDAHKTTWTHPRSPHGHIIDFIITRCRDKMDICSTRTMRGANCGTDHQMLRSRDIDPGDIEREVLENTQKRSVNTAMDEKPTMDEMVRAIKGLKDGKAPGGDGIPAEVWKYGGANLSNRLHRWITKVWE